MGISLIYRSKRSAWYSISVLLPLAFAVVMLFMKPWFIAFTMLPVLLMAVPIYFRTYYKIHDINRLTVVCGLFYRKIFPIEEILSIRPTSNVMSSPALSLDRLELRFRNKQTLLISPVKPEEFTKLLLSINPEIEVRKR